MIIISPLGGLCNRICAIYSAACMALDKKDELYIIWGNSHCDVPCFFEDLFLEIKCTGVKITVINLISSKNSLRSIVKKGEVLGLLTELKIRKNYHRAIMGYKKKADSIIDIYESLPENFNLKKMEKIYITSCSEIYGNRSYDMIRFRPEFYKLVHEILDCPRSSVIGIHIRRTDLSEYNTYSSSELFAKKVEENINRNPYIKFFVSTDDERELKRLQERFGKERILAQNKTYERFSLKGQQEAIVDLLCLARCSKIYGCVHSSFSYVASRIGQIELERIGKRK